MASLKGGSCLLFSYTAYPGKEGVLMKSLHV